MDLTLSWDLFIAFFFSVVTAYSFIIGKHQTLTILIAVYIAVLATQGLGNLFMRFSGEAEPVYRIFKVLGVTLNVSTISLSRLILFMAIIIAVALKGGFSVQYGKSHSSVIALTATGLFGFATAGLIIITLLTFVAGSPLLDPTLGTREILMPLMKQSNLAQVMIQYQDLWYSLPALLLVCFGLLREEGA
ncbi:MAG TPA: hypothetical protein VJB82_01985 [Candidatus Peribacterales bacterium]|nr:hypothetical protein [Candidatus Peribacterales bacterium]